MPSPIKYDHVVRAASGDLYRVRYVYPDNTADVYPLDGRLSDTITLPIAELRRVSDPHRRRVPIENIPADRPACPWCDRPLPMLTNDTCAGLRVIRREFLRWNAYRGIFDRASCAIDFAAASYRGGYRRQNRSPKP